MGLAHDPTVVEEMSYAFCKRQKESNVIYTEARYSPHLLLPDSGGKNMEPDERFKKLVTIVEQVQLGLKRGHVDFGVHVNQILCCICFNPEWSPEVTLLAKHFNPEGMDGAESREIGAVVSADVAAGEAHFTDPKMGAPHMQCLNCLFQEQVVRGITIHAGEATGGAA